MALTPQQEQQLTQLLTLYTPLLELAGQATEIEVALGYGDVRVIDLPLASPLFTDDVMYLAQQGADVKASVQQFAQFTFDSFIDDALANALASYQAQVNAAIASMQTQINQAIADMQAQVNGSLSDNKSYYLGQL